MPKHGIVYGVYLYNDKKIFWIKDKEKEYFEDENGTPVTIKDDNDLQTLLVRRDGELKSPWNV